MPTYIAECYWPGVSDEELLAAGLRVHRAAMLIAGRGGHLRFRGSWLVPDDEVAFLLFEGTDAAVRAASEQARLPFERIVETIEIPGCDESIRVGVAHEENERHRSGTNGE
jgi:hypothetical protein